MPVDTEILGIGNVWGLSLFLTDWELKTGISYKWTFRISAFLKLKYASSSYFSTIVVDALHRNPTTESYVYKRICLLLHLKKVTHERRLWLASGEWQHTLNRSAQLFSTSNGISLNCRNWISESKMVLLKNHTIKKKMSQSLAPKKLGIGN